MARQRIINYGLRAQPQRGAIRFYNASDVSIPAFYPISLGSSNVDSTNPFEASDGTQLDSPILEVFDGIVGGLPFVNDKKEVGPHSYGTGTLQHPMAIAVDPESFPIWNGNFNDPPTVGTAQEYIDASAINGQGAGFPPIGFNTSPQDWPNAPWAPASFSPLTPIWKPLCWDKNSDGGAASDRVIAVPWNPGEPFPFAGAQQINLQGQQLGPEETEITEAVTVISPAMYQIALTCAVSIDTPGASVGFTMNYMAGPNSQSVSQGGIVSWGSTYVALPQFSVGSSGIYSDTDTVTYTSMGSQNVTLISYGFAWPGDTWTLVANASEDCAVVVLGILSWSRIGASSGNLQGSASQFGNGNSTNWNGWWGGWWGWGWGVGSYGYWPSGISASWW